MYLWFVEIKFRKKGSQNILDNKINLADNDTGFLYSALSLVLSIFSCKVGGAMFWSMRMVYKVLWHNMQPIESETLGWTPSFYWVLLRALHNTQN